MSILFDVLDIFKLPTGTQETLMLTLYLLLQPPLFIFLLMINFNELKVYKRYHLRFVILEDGELIHFNQGLWDLNRNNMKRVMCRFIIGHFIVVFD